MYRPFLFFITFFVPGIILGSLINFPRIFFTIALFCILIRLFCQNKRAKVLFLVICILFSGAFYYNFRIGRIGKELTNYALTHQTLVGIITNSPVVKHNKVTYDINVKYILHENEYRESSGKLRLSSDIDKDSKIYGYGDIVRFSGKLRVPQGKRNPGGIDYKAYLLQKGITTTMFSREIELIGGYSVNPVVKTAFALRAKLIAFYESNLPPNISALLGGITLGIKDSMPGDIKRSLGDTGVLHVFAVSGLHVGVIYGFIKILLDRFYIPKTLNFFITSGILIFYCYMVGLTPSAIRATIMLIMMLLGGVVERESDVLNNLCLSASILLLINPLNLFSISFQLSFAAVLGILLFFKIFQGHFYKFPKYLRDSLAVIFSAQILVFPFLAYYFNIVSIIGFLINLIIVPIASLVLVLGLLTGMVGILWPFLGSIIVKIPGFLLVILGHIINWGSKLSFSKVVVGSPSPVSIILYFILVILILQPKEQLVVGKFRKMAIFLTMLIMILQILPLPRGLEVTFIDVGQGDAVFIKTNSNHTVLIDGGGIPSFYNSDFDIGADVLEPFLYSQGISHLDIVVFTHFDEDHSQGLLSILDNIKIGSVFYGYPDESAIYKKMKKITQEKGIKTYQLSHGDGFDLDDVVFEVLNPLPQYVQYASSNDNSVVIKMTYKGFTFLFTGDLEHYGEQKILNTGIDLKADVLKVGHHGSVSSTSRPFISQVRPSFAVISVGEDNTFGHPAPQVLETIKSHDAKILRTDIHGAITFKIQGSNVKIYTTIPGEL